MNHQNRQKHLTHEELVRVYPRRLYPELRPNQEKAFRIIEQAGGSVLLELNVGEGKTLIGYTFLKALEKRGLGPLFYIVPTKALVEQVSKMFPEVAVAYGRNEHPCFYYPDQNLKADEIPCALLVDCPHRVDQETGETHTAGAIPCPYLEQKFLAKRGKIVVCTMSFYLFTQLFSKEWETPAGLVIDEVHKIARVVRNSLSYEITDYHLERAITALSAMGATEEVRQLGEFRHTMIEIIRSRPAKTKVLLEAFEIRELMDCLMKIDPKLIRQTIKEAVQQKRIDPKLFRHELKQVEVLTHELRRYLSSFEYSLPVKERQPLNYTFGYYEKERLPEKKAQHRLVIKAYHVAPIIERLLPQTTLAYSATIGESKVFGWDTGIRFPFHSLSPEFPAENTRIFLPIDTPNLAVKNRQKGEPARILRKITQSCKLLAKHDIRSLVVVVSEKERQKFLALCREEEVEAVSYGNGIAAKDAALKFKAGEGEILVGTVANYGEGVDLPRQMAPVIFFLRPGYPHPEDPAVQFEERRWGTQRWKLWNWRVMIEALQVRGRNVRSSVDLGVCFFISQQFRRFLWAALPSWMEDSYKGDKTLEDGIKETIQLLKGSI